MQTQLVVLQGDIRQLNVDAKALDLTEDTASAYHQALDRARLDNARSIAFPCISGKNASGTAEIALKAVRDFLKENPGSFTEIIFACWDQENYAIYKAMLGGENRVINIR
jgi:O-acetyl-ADP-ribose deacetylase (regulator of RNase III)